MGTKRRNRKLIASSSISSQQLLVICRRLNFFSIAFIAGASTTRVTVNDNKLAHTAEHAFIGSLQKLFGYTLKVRKVQHRGSSNTVFIVIPQLDLDTVLKAETEVNSLIAKGRRITWRTFSSLEEARHEIPNLRANEQRITAGDVKVVEIENHEIANIVFACNEKMEGIDLNKMFKQFADADGRGGGNPHFVTGIVKKHAASRVLESVEREILCKSQSDRL